MTYKQRSNGLPFKQMGSTPAKHGTTDDFLYGRNGHNPDIMEGKHEDWHTDKIEAEKKKPSPNKQQKLQGGIPSETGDTNLSRLWKKSVKQDKKEKDEKLQNEKLKEGRRKVDKVSIAKQTTNSKVITKDNEITIAANKKAAEIGKRGNKGKKRSDYTPDQLALIKNPAYQKALNLALEKLMKDNPDTTGE